MTVGDPPSGPRLDGAFRLAVVKSPDLAAPLIGALDAADVGAWVWIEAEGCLYWSPRVLDLLSFDPSGDDLPSRFVNAVHPEDRAAVGALIAGDWQDDSFHLRFRFLDRDGGYRWLSTRGRIERDRQGTLVRQGGTLRDITDEVAQEQARAEASARLEALVNAMPFAVWGRSGPDLRITHQNAESIAWWGDLLGRGVEDVPPSVARVWRAQVAEAMSGSVVRHRSHYPGENRMRVVDEIIAPVIVEGEATGVVGVGRDVTDEHRQQEFEELLTDVTAEFASQSAATLDAALVGALERIGRFLGAPLSTLCELSDDNWLSVTHWWADVAGNRPFATEIDCAPVAILADQLKANQPVVVRSLTDFPEGSATRHFLNERRLESFVMVPTRQSDGTLAVLAVAGASGERIDWAPDTVPLLRLAGTLMAGVLARLRAEANQRLVERRMQETQKLESLGVLAGGIAHDFNNLLTSILGYASLLRADHGEVKGISDPLEQIEQAARRAADLCRQMLAYAGKGRFALQLININEIVRDSQSLLRVSIPRKATLQLSLSPGLPPVLADQAQLRQLLMNLLINAGEALGDREGRITITTSTMVRSARELAKTVFTPDLDDGKYVCVSIKDTGEGMTPETLARIFDPFFSTKFTGRGLGLSAVVGIVRAHKGALRVESRPGEGSTFELLLPAQAGPPATFPTPPLYNLATRLDWISTGTVLVVDDEPGIRELVRNVLQRAGLSVVLAEDGRQGVEAFRAIANDVRLVLVDLTMPGLDGREALAAMRQIRSDVQAILMTGYTPDNVGVPSSHAFLQKPFTPAGLRAVVRRVLGEDS